MKELVREEMCGAYALDPPLAVDVGVGRRLDRGEELSLRSSGLPEASAARSEQPASRRPAGTVSVPVRGTTPRS